MLRVRSFTACVSILLFASLASADPLVISFVPSAQTVATGPILVDVTVSGFSASTASSVGDFAFTISYDPSIVTATSVAFDVNLGDPSLFEALTSADWFTTPGVINFSEVSLLAPADLEALQAHLLPTGFLLAELSFDPAGTGTTPLNFTAGIAGDSQGHNVPLVLGSGSITVVPEPNTFALLFTGGLLFLFLRLRKAPLKRISRCFVMSLLAASALRAAPAPKFGPHIKLLDGKGNEAGIEYAVGTTDFPRGSDNKFQAIYNSYNLRTPITFFNTTAQEQRIIVCATGVTDNLNPGAQPPVTFSHMQVQMKVDANNTFTCDLPAAQTLTPKKFRFGSMGCRLITIPANGQSPPKGAAGDDAFVGFVSGNDRTIPMFDAKGMPVAGKFSVIGGFGGVGPTQTGQRGSGFASGTGWGMIGGHPTSPTNVVSHLSFLDLNFIVLQDATLKFAADPTPSPARANGTFNCNKCFGMGRTGAVPTAAGDTGLGPFRGYRLAPISPDDRKNIKAIFANNWVNYSSLKLKAGSTTLSSLSLSSEDTYFAAAPVQAQYTLQTINMPLGCAVTTTSLVDEDGNTSSLSAGTTFTISPEQLLQLSVSVSCDSTLSPGSIGELIATVSNTDPSDHGILSQSFIRMLAPITCDVNADGSVDAIDIADIMALNGTPAPPGSPYDVDGDGIITVNDARICTLQCSLPLCAVPPPQ